MCTAITFTKKDFYFGRTLDLECSYGEEVVISPRNFPFSFRNTESLDNHFAIIGMAHVSNGYPLYYDAINESGLCMAGLNFPGMAHYQPSSEDKINVASFEFIPWVLGLCGNVKEAREKLLKIQLTEVSFSRELPATPLHWIIADKNECITVEALKEGIRIHENPVGVLTNTPTFDDQMFHLINYMQLSPWPPRNCFSSYLDLKPYSRGMGAIGLPGDLSSQSRFIRAAFVKLNSLCSEEESVSQFFHILDSVKQVRGCCRLEDGSCEITQYTSCCNTDCGIYYYTTYGNRRISAVNLHEENLDADCIFRFPLISGEDICFVNNKGCE